MGVENLKQIGKLWETKELPENVVENTKIKEITQSIFSLLSNKNPKSILITGENGVGKSTIINLVAKEFKKKNRLVFIGSAANVMAGQKYIGEMEQQVKDVLQSLAEAKNSLWIIPRFHELVLAGRHQYSTISILDQVLPFVESGEVRIIGELSPSNLERTIQQFPQLLGVFEIIRIDESSKNFTVELAKDWIKADSNKSLWSKFSEDDIEEVYQLSSQYLSHKQNPGNLLDLLKQTKKLIVSKKDASYQIDIKDFIQSLSNSTGLPENILDDSEKLDLDYLKNHFSTKVIGQDDAVNTIIERVAMIKAGLTDPSKPSGIFLFVGPTGTGKTEIAKTLAEYLFGSPERLIRLDMSEFQNHDSIYKLLGDSYDSFDDTSLINKIRKNPFSVILLDEFEKAHPTIWDFFLQVFDDGRLSDTRGLTADFRNSIIILTSNLGASLPASTNRIGFNSAEEHTDIDANILASIQDTFRPEFVNRIDKVVVFNPLTKAVAKQILKNELKKVLTRRGLRRKKWELDFEDSALDFLLDKGFSSTMGARPLKRAIEKYLLAPLAITIVNHNFPKGNQFLLVGVGKDKLKVEFIDPDEPQYTWEQKKKILESQEVKSKELSLKEIVLDSNGVLSEFRLIENELKKLDEDIKENGIEETKTELLQEMAVPDFWNSADRFEILAEVEFIDRFESAYETAQNLFNRLNDTEKERLSYDARLIKKLAERIYLLKEALDSYLDEIPQDAFIKIEFDKNSENYGAKIESMYASWAKTRNMNMRELKSVDEVSEIARYFSVSGFAAFNILNKESGYHIFEVHHDKSDKVEKHKVKVIVLPMELEDYRLKDVNTVINRFEYQKNQKNTRRYKLQKSPVIKDLKNNWQTGKTDRVLFGDFDLFE